MQNIVYNDNNDDIDDEKLFLWYSSFWKVHETYSKLRCCQKFSPSLTLTSCIQDLNLIGSWVRRMEVGNTYHCNTVTTMLFWLSSMRLYYEYMTGLGKRNFDGLFN